MIKITLAKIREHSPCKSGWRRVSEANGSEPFPVSSILDSNGFADTLWTLRCLPKYNQLWNKFACWCASEVVELIEDKVDGNYLTIVDYLNDPTESKRENARSIMRRVENNTRINDLHSFITAVNAVYDATDYNSALGAFRVNMMLSEMSYLMSTHKRLAKLRKILDAGEWVD